jgi:tellurite resistance protein TerC
VQGVAEILPWAVLVVAVIVFLEIDLHWFARGREPEFREGVLWSIGWLVLAFVVAGIVYALRGQQDAIEYTTVYLIERSLSLDNLFVFLLLFAYFGIPTEYRPRLLFWGIIAALVLRLVAIIGGVTLLNALHFVIYILAAALLILAIRIWRGVGESVDPDKNLMVRAVRRFFPVSNDMHYHYFVHEDGVRKATPLLLCLAAVVFADIAFAIDSIPAAFAITRDPFIIWMGNVFALIGLRALFVLVEGLVRRFRYLDQTIAVVLGAVAVKLAVEDLVHIGPLASLAGVAALFTIGIVLSLIADRRDPEGAERRKREVAEQGKPSADSADRPPSEAEPAEATSGSS